MDQTLSQASIDRRMCQRSLYYLCKEVLGYKDMVTHVHGYLCDFLTNPVYGRFRQSTMPRSWFKSWVATVGFSIWLTLPDEEGLYTEIFPYKGPNVRILIASNVIDNAAKMIHKIKAEWESNDRLRAAFPELLPDFNKIRWSDHVAEVRRTLKSTEGTYTAVGAGGSVISQHFDHIVEDDLIYARKDDFTGQELMPSQEDIDNAIGWHKLAFSLLANPQTGCISNVGTRWAPRDLIYYIRTFEHSYKCFEASVTKDATWPILDDSSCVWPERYNKFALDLIAQAQGPRIFECFPAEAPILKSDWSCIPIKDIKLGDEVVGFTNGSGVGKGRLTKAKVTLVECLQKKVVKITLASGKVIRCTEDHPWYTGRKDKSHASYLPAKVGRKLLEVYNYRTITQEELLDYRYLAGLVDGEGACNHGSIAIAQSKAANPDVYNGIEAVLHRLGIPYHIGKVNPNDTHVLRNWTVRRGLGETFVLGGGRNIKGDIIRFGKPAKAARILNTIWGRPHGPIKGEDEVISIVPDGEETVYAIGTTTGNYVAYGFATKNTQYLNRPRAMEDIVFKREYVHCHATMDEFPEKLEYHTIVDLAGWGDGKGLARNVILTGSISTNNHMWIARVTVGRFTPTEVINLFKEHSRQFGSRIHVEEIQYQRAISHFSRQQMEETGEWFIQERLPYDGRKDAKNLRIRALEPVIRMGGLHIMGSMSDLLEELELYPHGKTVDILDCMGYLLRVGKTREVTPPPPPKSPLSMEVILDELKLRSRSDCTYPFQMQLRRPNA